MRAIARGKTSRIQEGVERMSVKVIAYDVGTTGLKTCLFSISAEESVQYLAGEVEHYALHVLPNGGVEQDADDWWEAMARSTRVRYWAASMGSMEPKTVSEVPLV